MSAPICKCGHHKNYACHRDDDLLPSNCCCGGYEPVAERSEVVSAPDYRVSFKANQILESVDGGARPDHEIPDEPGKAYCLGLDHAREQIKHILIHGGADRVAKFLDVEGATDGGARERKPANYPSIVARNLRFYAELIERDEIDATDVEALDKSVFIASLREYADWVDGGVREQAAIDLVKAAVHLAILRHDLGEDDMDIDAILEDTANAVRGIDTCAEEPIPEWEALRAAVDRRKR